MLSQQVTVEDQPYLVLSTVGKRWAVVTLSRSALRGLEYVSQWCPQDWPWIQSRTELIWLIFPSSAFSSYPMFRICPCVPDVIVVLAWFHITTFSPDCLIQISLEELRLVKQTSFKSNSYELNRSLVRTLLQQPQHGWRILHCLKTVRRPKSRCHVTHPSLLTLEHINLGHVLVTLLHS